MAQLELSHHPDIDLQQPSRGAQWALWVSQWGVLAVAARFLPVWLSGLAALVLVLYGLRWSGRLAGTRSRWRLARWATSSTATPWCCAMVRTAR